MTPKEWMMEAHDQWIHSEAGQKAMKMEKWAADAELTEEEWKAKYGITKN